jgi:hypothetical protein
LRGLSAGADDEDAPELLLVARLPLERELRGFVRGEAVRCSCADQRSDSSVAAFACFWPMRGWLSKASCHASRAAPNQTASEEIEEMPSSAMGRRAASAAAHACEPQQGSISLAAEHRVERVPSGEDRVHKSSA